MEAKTIEARPDTKEEYFHEKTAISANYRAG
jgi:hypothetical protein